MGANCQHIGKEIPMKGAFENPHDLGRNSNEGIQLADLENPHERGLEVKKVWALYLMGGQMHKESLLPILWQLRKGGQFS